jgi:uncharacterized FlaG/YvyC family protein
MADQVNPMGNLASGLPPVLLAATLPGAAPVKSAPAENANDPSPVQGGQAPPAPAQATETAAKQINEHLQQTNSELQIQTDKDTGRIVYKVINTSTGQTVLQVPSEDVLAMARNLRSLDKQMGVSGVLVDKKG